ncbi:MAG: hypothetical protein COB22_06260 [Cycloclasticus sp.]|nr:MAG: hypothetical protein COB22_06260 [Cycloclasticus sp.]
MTDKKKEHVSEQVLTKKLKETLPKTLKEINGRSGLEPTRFGDWEKNGRCIDF